ncbi:unnamed protein product [Medioppia subpectinata]|uniref:Cytochrome P450 n=1 Tax=Medioppia subpectinata TaxID=1979941 RepID=A0A7R9L1R7_9ACAR|nr:unnamed protein product [Medioppia subpectinata]CAG2113637.1 unnamed protein product [Medioppia subpectinata]
MISVDIRTAIISIIIGYIVYKLAKFYTRVYQLPPGPIPVPFLGSIFHLKGTKDHWTDEFNKYTQKYGNIFTFWLSGDPIVVINDIDLGKELFRKNDVASRWQIYFLGADYGHTWEALRRVGHSAVQKYSASDKLVLLAKDCVEQTVKLMVDNEGLNKPFVATNYVYQMFFNILSTSAFGKSYEMNNKEYKQLKYVMKDFIRENSMKFMILQVLPVARYAFKGMADKQERIMNEMVDMLKNKFVKHYEDFDESSQRDFCDALISAKNDALRDGKESAPYLTDDNLALTIFDLFFAGTDTSQQTFQWLLLFLCYYPEIQKKLRQEIESQIGDRMPTHEDRNRCHYVMAFIAEAMRFRNVVPMSPLHKTVVQTKIGDYTVPKDTAVTLYHHNILNNPKYWENPNQLIPERFLDSDGQYMTSHNKAFIPFGVGRRVCLGEKLAIADLFLVLVSFLQSTQQYDIVLAKHLGIDPDPNIADTINPKPYQIKLVQKSRQTTRG